jgi:hypothetical protein
LGGFTGDGEDLEARFIVLSRGPKRTCVPQIDYRRTTDGQINERPKKVEEFGVYLTYRGSKIPLGSKRLADGVLTPPFYDRIIPHAYEGYEDPSFVFALLSLVGLAFYDFTSTP